MDPDESSSLIIDNSFLVAHVFEEHRQFDPTPSEFRKQPEPARIFYLRPHEKVRNLIGEPFSIEQEMLLRHLDSLEKAPAKPPTDKRGPPLDMSTPSRRFTRATLRSPAVVPDWVGLPASKRQELALADVLTATDMVFLDTAFWQVHMRVSAERHAQYKQDLETWRRSDRSTAEPAQEAYKVTDLPLLKDVCPKLLHVGLPTSMLWSDLYHRPMLEHVYQIFPKVKHFWFFTEDFLRIPVKHRDSYYPSLVTTYMSTAQKRIHGVRGWWRPLEPGDNEGMVLYEKLHAKALKHANHLRFRGWNRTPDKAPESINFRIAQWQLDPPLAYPNDRTEYDAWNPHPDFDCDSDLEANLGLVAKGDLVLAEEDTTVLDETTLPEVSAQPPAQETEN